MAKESQDRLEEREASDEERALDAEETGENVEFGVVKTDSPVDLDEEGNPVDGAVLNSGDPIPFEQKIRIIEAALFLANKPLTCAELAVMAKCTVKKARDLVVELRREYAGRDTALTIDFFEDSARLQVAPKYASAVAGISREVNLSKKALKILGLIAKKKQFLQSDLKDYFKGEIYAYVTELKDQGYIISEKKGNTRVLKPTKRFFEHFQLSGSAALDRASQTAEQTKLDGQNQVLPPNSQEGK